MKKEIFFLFLIFNSEHGSPTCTNIRPTCFLTQVKKCGKNKKENISDRGISRVPNILALGKFAAPNGVFWETFFLYTKPKKRLFSACFLRKFLWSNPGPALSLVSSVPSKHLLVQTSSVSPFCLRVRVLCVCVCLFQTN